MMIKKVLRSILRIKENETVADGIERHYYHFEKRIPYRKISREELGQYLDEIGVKKRGCFNCTCIMESIVYA